MDTIKQAFDLVRKDDVILWIGAGFSRCVGYPSGGELANLLNNELPKEHRLTTTDLSEISERYSLVYTRDSLIRFLRNIFTLVTPNNDLPHNRLATIPQIKTIITTNYDSLIENSYGSDAVVVRSDYDLSHIENNKTAIFKIHGDFFTPDDIVITHSDYAKWQNRFLQTGMYHLMMERLTTKTVIFIGYGITDINVLTAILNVTDSLKQHRKRWYYVAPKIPEIKTRELNLNYNIASINMSGAEFISALEKHLNDTILADIKRKTGSLDAQLAYAQKRDVAVEIKSGDTGNTLLGVSSIKGQHFSFSITSPKYAKAIQNPDRLINGVKIPQSALTNLKLEIGDLRHPDYTDGNIKEITILPSGKEMLVSIIFCDQEYEYVDIPVTMYHIPGGKKTRFIGKFDVADVEIMLTEKKGLGMTFHLKVKHKTWYGKTANELRFFKLLSLVTQKERFRIITNDFKFEYTMPIETDSPFARHTLRVYKFLLNLSRIERKCGVQFNQYKEPKQDNRLLAARIADAINGVIGHPVDNSDVIDVRAVYKCYNIIEKNAGQRDGKFIASLHDNETIVFLGQKIELGYQCIEIDSPTYLNDPDFGENVELRIQALKENVKIYYSTKPIQELYPYTPSAEELAIVNLNE